MSSTVSDASHVVEFAPDEATLAAAIARLDDEGAGGAVDAARRREALSRFAALPAPGLKFGRGWKHDYDKLSYAGLRWASDRRTVATLPFAADADAEADRPALETASAAGVVHVGATLLERAGEPPSLPRGVVVGALGDARRTHGAQLAAVHGTIVDWRRDRFAALSTAFQNCGAFVYVPDGIVVEAPIQLLFANADADDEAVFPHVVVVLGAGAQATVLERHAGSGEPLVCGIVEAHCGQGASLDYAVVQQAGEAARVMFSRGARCERGAHVRWHVAELGGTLVRTVVETQLTEPGAEAQTSALFFNTGFQHVDLTSGADHRVGPTHSETVVRSAATGRGQGRYVGNIVIRPKAHGSDASLRDDALLLSKHAHIDSVPALEIAANDVTAFHGATVGSLDEDALFYAGSRGIARQQALRLITLGFFEPVVSRFPTESLRDEVRTALDHKIDAATDIDG